MTNTELNRIAEEIRDSKTSKHMTKREFINALGCEKRTSGNVVFINKWLNDNQLITMPDYVGGIIDEPMELRFKYQIKHTHFQLYSLKINSRYRNLNDVFIDFEHTDQYCTLIGLNGSGKSNVIEAISEIFYSLYKKSPCSFHYILQYIMDGEFYEIKDGKINGIPVTDAQLPRNIVASYSGEDNRMWKSHYWPFYQEYCQHITDTPNIAVPKMMVVGRKQWNIAFLTLLYARSVNITVDDFLKSIINLSECRIQFKYNQDNFNVWKETIGKNFVRHLMSKTNYSVDEFASTINSLDYVDSPSTLFNLLYQATAERGNNPISDVDIIIDGHGSLNGLSEGEKKMIVVITIMEILSTERSLCLFDEPDSHVHVSRKMEMLNLIDMENRYSVLTTHSPMFIDEDKEGNIRFMNNGKVENVDKLKLVKQLSGGAISLIDAAYIVGWKKKILFGEGQYDFKYLGKAIEKASKMDQKYLKLEKNVTILSIGGTGDSEAKYEELIEHIVDDLDKVVFIFDYDQGGIDGWIKIEGITKKKASLSTKLISLFYQQNYTTPILPTKGTKPKSSDTCQVEDFFNPNDYIKCVEKLFYINDSGTVRNRSSHKDFREYDGGQMTKAIKEYIKKNYSTFTDYSGFIPVLDKLLEVFNL